MLIGSGILRFTRHSVSVLEANALPYLAYLDYLALAGKRVLS